MNDTKYSSQPAAGFKPARGARANTFYTVIDDFPAEVEEACRVPGHRTQRSKDGRLFVETCSKTVSMSESEAFAPPSVDSISRFGGENTRVIPTATFEKTTLSADADMSQSNPNLPHLLCAGDSKNLIARSVTDRPRTLIRRGGKLSDADVVFYVAQRFEFLAQLAVVVRTKADIEAMTQQLRAKGLKVFSSRTKPADGEGKIFDTYVCHEQEYLCDPVVSQSDIIVVTEPDRIQRRTRMDLAFSRRAHVVGVLADSHRANANEQKRLEAHWGCLQLHLCDLDLMPTSPRVHAVLLRKKPKRVAFRRSDRNDSIRGCVYQNDVCNRQIMHLIRRLNSGKTDLTKLLRRFDASVIEERHGPAIVVVAGDEQLLAVATRCPNTPILHSDVPSAKRHAPQIARRCIDIASLDDAEFGEAPVYLVRIDDLTHCPPAQLYLDVSGGRGPLPLSARQRGAESWNQQNLVVLSLCFDHYRAGRDAHSLKLSYYRSKGWFLTEATAKLASSTGRAPRAEYSPGYGLATPGTRSKTRWKRKQRTSTQITREDLYDAMASLRSPQHGDAAGPDGVSIADVAVPDLSAITSEVFSRVIEGPLSKAQPGPVRHVKIPKTSDPSQSRQLDIRNLTDRAVENVLSRWCSAVIKSTKDLGDATYCISGRGRDRMLADIFNRFSDSGGELRYLTLTDIRNAYPNTPAKEAYLAIRHLSSVKALRGTSRTFSSHIERCLKLIRQFLLFPETDSEGLSQGSPLSMLALDAFLKTVHDQPLKRLVGHRSVFRYVDNIVYLSTSDTVGHRALDVASERLARKGMELKAGPEYGVFDLRTPEEQDPMLLGYQLKAVDGHLRAGLPTYWRDSLRLSLRDCYGSSHPVRAARSVIKGWLASYSLCTHQRHEVLSNMEALLKQEGFNELCTPGTRQSLLSLWGVKYASWKRMIQSLPDWSECP